MNRMNNHVHILTMGGTIDKDYPKLLGGYAFEYGEEAAATRILNTHPNLGITYVVTSVCKKDSLEMTNADRDLLVVSIRKILAHRPHHSSSAARIVITHGTDTMVETARYVHMRISGDNPFDFVIAFTGSTKPERFVDSDASFNLGAAISATSICSPGSIMICMNGNAIPVGECTRDEKLGIFIRSTT